MEYIDILTFLAGYFISELLRRWNRIESYNSQIFSKRLDVYCKLYSLWNKSYCDVIDLIEDLKENKQEYENKQDIHAEIFILIRPLFLYLDESSLFLSEELKIQCATAFVSDMTEEGKWDEYIAEIRQQNIIVKKMILDESGMSSINKKIKQIVKYKHKSPIIDYYHQLKKQKND